MIQTSRIKTWTAALLAGSLLIAGGCGHTAESGAPVAVPAPAPSEATPTPPPPRAAAPDEDQPAPAPRAATAPRFAPGPPPAAQPIGSVMAEHFVLTNWARDVVVSGQIDPLREVLAAFAEYEYETIQPGAWEPWIAKLQAAARVSANAPNLRVAAKGVAAMGRICGECHRANHGGPKISSDSTEVFLPYSETFPERMDRHMWAAEQLWFGLTRALRRELESGRGRAARCALPDG